MVRELLSNRFWMLFFNMKQLLKKDAKKTADQKCDRTFNSIIEKKQLNKAHLKKLHMKYQKLSITMKAVILRELLSLMCYTLEMHSALDINDEGNDQSNRKQLEYAKEIKF